MLAMVPKNHPNGRKRKRGVDDSVDDRETPADVFDPLDMEFRFTLDVAAARHNAKCPRYYALGPTPGFDPRQGTLFPELYVGDAEALGLDGLHQPWAKGERIWCNPPFSDIRPWVRRATYCEATVVMLLPANRTEQPWWQTFIEHQRDGRAGWLASPQTRFLAGRRCFRRRGEEIGNKTSRNPPFGLVVVIWDRRES